MICFVIYACALTLRHTSAALLDQPGPVCQIGEILDNTGVRCIARSHAGNSLIQRKKQTNMLIAKEFEARACASDGDCTSDHFCASMGLCVQYDGEYCESNECGLGDGDCDNDAHCRGDLICGTDNCGVFHGSLPWDADCCYQPLPPTACTSDDDCSSNHFCASIGFCVHYDGEYCESNECGPGDGDCDNDAHCSGNLICGRDNCQEFHSSLAFDADCCYLALPPGACSSDNDCSSDYFCASFAQCARYDGEYCESNECGLGDGDCDNDAHCSGDLICGTDNCQIFHGSLPLDADCCYQPLPQFACSSDDDCSSEYFCASTGFCVHYDGEYCDSNECGLGDGDCDDDAQCSGDLLCGTSNCRSFHASPPRTADCCYQANQLATSTPTVHLTNVHFQQGTYIIRAPGTYILDEDITFEPQTPSMLPPLDHPVYSRDNGYWLGFFAAISVSANDVVIDLNQKSIKMSYKFAITQRFFSIIELGSKPFVANTGPPQFATNSHPLFSAQRVTIKNGELGLSSHMGIHGNGNTGIHIKNVIINDFETGGIQLNGAADVEISSCTIGPSLGATGSDSRGVPGLATLSQAKLLLNLARASGHELDAPIVALRDAVTAFENDQSHGSETQHFRDPEFYSMGLPDGSALYGILFHKIGPAIHDFAACTNAQLEMLEGDPLENIIIRDTVIKDLHLKSDEVVKMFVNGNPVLGPAGDVVQVARLRDSNNAYSGSALSNAQAHLASLKAADASEGHSDDYLFRQYGSTNVPNPLLEWMEGRGTWAAATDGAEFRCDHDAMSHFNKGVVGMRLEFVTNVQVSNVSISGLKNYGVRSPHTSLCTTSEAVYHGADVRGVSLAIGVQPSDISGGYTVDLDSCSSASGTVSEIVEETARIVG